MSLKNLSYICSRRARWAQRVRRDARVVDWGGLENRCPGNWTEGSNPSLSAKYRNASPDKSGLVSVLWSTTSLLAGAECKIKQRTAAPPLHSCALPVSHTGIMK